MAGTRQRELVLAEEVPLDCGQFSQVRAGTRPTPAMNGLPAGSGLEVVGLMLIFMQDGALRTETLLTYQEPDGGSRLFLARGSDEIVENIITGSNSEKKIHELFRHLFREGCRDQPRLFVDVGANAAFYSLVASTYGCEVLLFDPQPSCIALAQTNICLNQHLTQKWHIIDRPVSDDTTEVKLSLPPTCNGRFDVAGGIDLGSRSTIKMVTPVSLDDLLLDSGVDAYVVKIDTEGFELPVVRSMQRLLAAGRVHHIVVEVTPVFWPHNGFTRREVYGGFLAFLEQGCTIQRVLDVDLTAPKGKFLSTAAELEEYFVRQPFEQEDLYINCEKKKQPNNSVARTSASQRASYLAQGSGSATPKDNVARTFTPEHPSYTAQGRSQLARKQVGHAQRGDSVWRQANRDATPGFDLPHPKDVVLKGRWPVPDTAMTLRWPNGTCVLKEEICSDPSPMAIEDIHVRDIISSCLMKCLFQPGCKAVDIGANVGMMTATMLQLGAHVISIEPQPDLCGSLDRTLARNNWRHRSRLFCGGVSLTPGVKQLDVDYSKVYRYGGTHRSGIVSVPVFNISQIMPPGHYEFVKIDTDVIDCEILFALVNMMQTGWSFQSFVLETWAASCKTVAMWQTLHQLQGMGYTVYRTLLWERQFAANGTLPSPLAIPLPSYATEQFDLRFARYLWKLRATSVEEWQQIVGPRNWQLFITKERLESAEMVILEQT